MNNQPSTEGYTKKKLKQLERLREKYHFGDEEPKDSIPATPTFSKDLINPKK